MFSFELLVFFPLSPEDVPHAEDVPYSVECRLRHLDRDENVFATNSVVVYLLPRVDLVNNRLGIVGQYPNPYGIELRRRRSTNWVEDGVFVPERDTSFVADVRFVKTAIAPEEALIFSESRL